MPSPTLRSASSAPASSKGVETPPESLPWNRYGAFLLISAIGCALDLTTKSWVFAWRGLPRPRNEWWIWEPYIGIETAVNTGALFGMGAGNGRVFALLSIVAALGILSWLFYAGAARDWWLTVTLGGVMGGILGNLYDRLGLWHQPEMPREWGSAVRDWILLRYGSYTWPNFNIADSLLVIGAAMLMWHALGERGNEANAPRSPEIIN